MRGAIAQTTLRASAVLGLRLMVQAGALLLVAHMLGPELFGAFAGTASLAVLLGALSTFGTHFVLLGTMAKAPERRLEVLAYALPLTLGCGTALLLAYLGAGSWLLRAQSLEGGWWFLLGLGLTELLLQPLFSLVVYEQWGAGHPVRSQLWANLPLVLRLLGLGGLMLLLEAPSLGCIAWVYVLASSVTWWCVWQRLQWRGPPWRLWCRPSASQRREALGFAVLGLTASGSAELDKALSAHLLPSVAAGLYAAGSRAVGATTLPVIALTIAALPRLFGGKRQGQSQSTRLERWLLACTFFYSLVVATLLWFTAPWLAALFGSAYAGMEAVIYVLCWAIPGMALRITAGSILMSVKHPWLRAMLEMVGVLVLGGASVSLTSLVGFLGMPWAMVCAEWTMAAMGLGFVFFLERKPGMAS